MTIPYGKVNPMKTSTPTALALEIRAEMARQQIGAGDLAGRCELSEPQVARRLSGAVALTVSDALLLADALGVPLWKLMQRATAVATEADRAA
jgi:transcriptional regulator with XRE-family HTH domain